MNRYLAFGEVLAADADLDYLTAPDEAGLEASLTLFRGEVPPTTPPEDHMCVHTEPDFDGGPVLEIWMAPGCITRAWISYAGWRVALDAGKGQMVYDAGEVEVPLRAVCERLLVPLCLLLDPARSLFALHGGAFVMNGRAWVLIGESGAGKSTSALKLVTEGAKILADDMALVDVEARLVLPGAPTLRLWQGVLDGAIRSAPIQGTDEKRWFHLGDDAGQDAPVELGGVIVLTPDPGAAITGEIAEVRGLEAMTLLLSNGFDLEHAPRVMQVARVKRARHLLEQMSVWRCRYARDPGGEPKQTRAILELIEGTRR